MITYVLMTGLGVVLALSAQYAHRTVTRCEPRLVEINPTIREIFLAAKDAGADDRGSRAREHSGDRLLLTVELVPKASRSGCAAASMSSQSEGQVIPGGWSWFTNSLPLSPRPSTR